MSCWYCCLSEKLVTFQTSLFPSWILSHLSPCHFFSMLILYYVGYYIFFRYPFICLTVIHWFLHVMCLHVRCWSFLEITCLWINLVWPMWSLFGFNYIYHIFCFYFFSICSSRLWIQLSSIINNHLNKMVLAVKISYTWVYFM